MNEPELLLRDIHLPEPVSWWPPAIGWWVLVIVGCGLVALVYLWRQYRLRQYRAPAAIAGRELERLQVEWAEHQDERRLQRDVSSWLRRVGMSLTSRREAASLTGPQWQQFLEELAGEAIFKEAELQLLTTVLYQPVNTDSEMQSTGDGPLLGGEHLLRLCQRWLDVSARRVKVR
jgi:hypothetical protein